MDAGATLSGHDDNLDRRPSIPDGRSKFQPIHRSGHVDVGQNKVDLAGTKTFNSLVCVGNSDHGMTRILQSQLNVHEDQGLVLDD